MQNRILLVVTIVLSLLLIIVSSKENTTFFNTEINIKVKDVNNNNINTLDLEDYVIGVVAAEMPASFEEEALKAQAVAARTYAMYKISNSTQDYDVVTDVTNQSYNNIEELKLKWNEDFDTYYTKIKKVVEDTKGKVMKYNNEYIEAYYFSMSNGYTEKASLVFNEDKEYLQPVEAIYDNNDLKNFEVTTQFTKEDFCKKLEITCDELIFSDIKRSDTNRVNSIKVNDKEFKGTSFRSKLNLRSTDFNIKEENNYIFITTKGYGHGVGMSQYGANGMARNGSDYKEILNYFYKNIEIVTI